MNTNEVIEEIKKRLQPALDKWVVARIQRIQDLNDYKKTDEYNNLEAEFVDVGNGHKVRITKGEVQFWHLIDLGYTKFETQNSRNGEKWIEAHYKKEAAHKSLRVDVAVNKKLSKINVKSIDQIGFRHGLDGFIEGDWIVTDTEDKQHSFKFETFLAGGYNIQCLHIRTKYTLKAIKLATA